MNSVRTIDDLDREAGLKGKRVLVRADLNVPIENGRITDTTRIERTLPTLSELSKKGARVVVLSHFGRPKGKRVPEMSLEPVRAELSRQLKRDVAFAQDCVGEAAATAVAALEPGDVLLLENTRFHPGEEKNDPEFAKALARSGDLYVNDGFSTSHRAHASTEGVAHLLPAAAGRGMEAELDALTRALTDPERPVVAVVGGAKISTKLELIGNLIGRCDHLVIGGAMANTFLAAEGKAVGKSLYEPDLLDEAAAIIARANEGDCDLVLPVDVVVAKELKPDTPAKTIGADMVPDDAMILDLGTASITEIVTRFEGARTVVWNGPLGAFEIPPFDNATNAAARSVAMLTDAGRILSVAGGGDTVAALNNAGVADRFSYVSTAGGAFLEWLEGKELPGVSALYKD